MALRATDLLRYALWFGVLGVAHANRKHFGLPTTWVFHASFNTFFLLLPEIYRGAARVLNLEAHARRQRDTVVDNPHYALYTAPVALAYMVSHPRFNIYKGTWAKLRLLGFGLDAIPHATTAFGFSSLIFDALAALCHHTPRHVPLRASVEWAADHAEWLAGALLVGASVIYETGEFAIHNEELRETGGDESKINMEWSSKDMLFDLLSNTLGWFAAVLFRRKRFSQEQMGIKNSRFA